jgi:hypothetical protein
VRIASRDDRARSRGTRGKRVSKKMTASVRKIAPMKKHRTPKKTAAKKRIDAKQAVPAASAQPAPSTTKKPLVSKQPRSKKEAAVQAGMFLYTDDNWSVAYFNDGDLHCIERKLFG